MLSERSELSFVANATPFKQITDDCLRRACEAMKIPPEILAFEPQTPSYSSARLAYQYLNELDEKRREALRLPPLRDAFDYHYFSESAHGV